ncbi:EF-hand calcium-binding domain-containing protein 6-like [Saccostrea echinata]|uniref:EF-hand calcium-binding domain-containing protein 6-like n=1 Tax=Saccostrea echinata TaxID=191078 RepID=UPI002A7FC3ED|nr:EF-hand calcium-binding domain-containing protein 6-like [Saccostrea echinata]
MAYTAAVPRVSAGPKRFPNLPIIQHPMSRMSNQEELAILGSASGLRSGKMSLQFQHSGTGDPSSNNTVRASAPERILQWPPATEFFPPFKYRHSATERMGLMRKKSFHKKKKPLILPQIETKRKPSTQGSGHCAEVVKLPPLNLVLDAITEEETGFCCVKYTSADNELLLLISFHQIHGNKCSQFTNPRRSEKGSFEKYSQGPHKTRGRQDVTSATPRTSEEVTEKVKDRLTTGYYGLRHMFKANDPTGKGVVSREALLRILYSLVGYITQEQYSKFLKGNSLDGKDHISFDSFVACFKDNETVQKEWVSPSMKLEMDKTRHYPEAELRRTDVIVTDPFLSAPYADTLFREKICNIEDARQIFPPACFQANGRIVPPQLREAHAQLGIFMKDADFMSLWQRYDKEGLGAIRTSLFLKRAGIDTRPKTYSHRSKTVVELKIRPKSEANVAPSKQEVDTKQEMNTTTQNETEVNTDKATEKIEGKEKVADTSKDTGAPDKNEDIKINISRKKKVQPKLENIIDCLHYRFEESYNAMLAAFDLFDYLSDGYIARVDFRRVLQEFGLNISVTDLDNFLAGHGVRTIRGQVNYKEFLNKFQSKSENSITNKVATSQQFQDNKLPSWPLPKNTLTSEQLDIRLVDLLHGDFLKLIGYFKSCDKYGLGVITPHEFRSGIEKRLGYPMSEKQWEQLKTDVGQDSDGLIPYNKFLQMFDVPPGSWNRRQEGGLDVYQVIPTTMVHSSAVDRLKEKAKTFMHPQTEVEGLPPQDNVRTIADVMKILEDLFRNRFHTFDKHFQDMDRRKTGRMSKWQFGALLRLSGVNLTNSELDRVWARLNISADGMYSYKSLIKAFAQNRASQDMKRDQTDVSDTRELIETAKRVQRERREKTMSSLQHNTTTVTTNNGEQTTSKTTTKTTEVVSAAETTTKTMKVNGVVQDKPPQTALSNKSQKTRDLLNKIKTQVIGNWEGLKTVFKFIDKNGSSTISISDMKEILNTMKFPLSEEEKRELCQRFDIQRNGRFHYLEFMKCYSQNPPNPTKSQVYSKHTHKLERKQRDIQSATVGSVISNIHHKLMAEHRNLRRAFRRLDVHRQGLLGVSDFRRALTGCNIHVSNEDFYHILSEFDQDMRGLVSYTDFLSTFMDNL